MRRTLSLIFFLAFAGGSAALFAAPLVSGPRGAQLSALDALREDAASLATTQLVGAGVCALLALICLISALASSSSNSQGESALPRLSETVGTRSEAH